MKFDVTSKDKVSELEMLAALVVATRGLRLPTPDYDASGMYSAQWKIHGNVLWYQLPASKGGTVLAVLISTKDRTGPFYFRKSGFKEATVNSNFLVRATSATAAADPTVPPSLLKPLMKKWLSMEDQDAADDITAILVEKKVLKKGDFDIEFESAEHGVLDIFFGKGRERVLRVEKDGSYEVI